MKAGLRVIYKRANGRFWDAKAKKFTTVSKILTQYQRCYSDAVRVLDGKGEDITESVLVNGAFKYRANDPMLRELVAKYLEETEA